MKKFLILLLTIFAAFQVEAQGIDFFHGTWRPQTRINGLWLTGQDILTCGVTGAMMAGMLSTMSIVGPRKMAPLMKRIYS